MQIIVLILKAIGTIIKVIAKGLWALVYPIGSHLYEMAVEAIKKKGFSDSGARALVSAIIVVAIIGVLSIL